MLIRFEWVSSYYTLYPLFSTINYSVYLWSFFRFCCQVSFYPNDSFAAWENGFFADRLRNLYIFCVCRSYIAISFCYIATWRFSSSYIGGWNQEGLAMLHGIIHAKLSWKVPSIHVLIHIYGMISVSNCFNPCKTWAILSDSICRIFNNKNDRNK